MPTYPISSDTEPKFGPLIVIRQPICWYHHGSRECGEKRDLLEQCAIRPVNTAIGNAEREVKRRDKNIKNHYAEQVVQPSRCSSTFQDDPPDNQDRRNNQRAFQHTFHVRLLLTAAHCHPLNRIADRYFSIKTRGSGKCSPSSTVGRL